MSNEQWKETGDCSLCRRTSYCKTECKKHKEFREYQIRQFILKKMFDKIIRSSTDGNKET